MPDIRKIATIVEINMPEREKSKLGEGDYLEREMASLKEKGIVLSEWLIADEDEEGGRWLRYLYYLIYWAFRHYEREQIGMSPPRYEEDWESETE